MILSVIVQNVKFVYKKLAGPSNSNYGGRGSVVTKPNKKLGLVIPLFILTQRETLFWLNAHEVDVLEGLTKDNSLFVLKHCHSTIGESEIN